MGSPRLVMVLMVYLMGSLLSGVRAGEHVEMEPKLKAVFLYNFLKLVKWEEESPDTPFVIVVYGDSKVVPYLEEISRVGKVKGRAIKLLKLTDLNDSDGGHIVFLSRSICSESGNMVAELGGKGVLLVTDCDDGGYRGSTINFIIMDGKLTFEVYMKALNHSELTASSQLLKLARIRRE